MALRILIVHNRYRFRGGEDTVVSTECDLLRAFGHLVEEYFESNDSPFGILDALEPIWSFRSDQRLREAIEKFKPDVVHCHNIHYRISPSVYWLCWQLGVPVVQTLHNYRIGCLNARHSLNGAPCELCLTRRLKQGHGIVRACFQQSRIRSAGLAFSLSLHRHLGTFADRVSKYIALSQFARTKHVLAGIPEGKIVVKPNCVYPDPGEKSEAGSFCFFAGRLEVDKGVRVLLQAAAFIPDIPIVIAGDGPLQSEVRDAASTLRNIQYLGPLSRNKVIELMRSAKLFVFPSLAYENFPMSIAEAFSIGLPVITSRCGAAAEIVEDTVNGLHFEPGSAAQLAERIRGVFSDTETVGQMGAAARLSFEQKYSGQCTYRALYSIYEELVAKPGHVRSLGRTRTLTEYATHSITCDNKLG